MQIWNFANPLDFGSLFFKKVLVPLTVKNFLCYPRLNFLTNLACLKWSMNINKLSKFALPHVPHLIRICIWFKIYWIHFRNVMQVIFEIEIFKVTEFDGSLLSFKRRKFLDTINKIVITNCYSWNACWNDILLPSYWRKSDQLTIWSKWFLS